MYVVTGKVVINGKRLPLGAVIPDEEMAKWNAHSIKIERDFGNIADVSQERAQAMQENYARQEAQGKLQRLQRALRSAQSDTARAAADVAALESALAAAKAEHADVKDREDVAAAAVDSFTKVNSDLLAPPQSASSGAGAPAPSSAPAPSEAAPSPVVEVQVAVPEIPEIPAVPAPEPSEEEALRERAKVVLGGLSKEDLFVKADVWWGEDLYAHTGGSAKKADLYKAAVELFVEYGGEVFDSADDVAR